MHTDTRISLVIRSCVVCFALLTFPGRAQQTAPPIPALPDPAAIARVIADSQGPTYTAIHAPVASLGALKSGPFAGVSQRLNPNKAVHVIGLGVGPRRSALPLQGAENATLQADTQTPDDGLPSQVIGAAVDPTQGALTVIAVWKNGTDKKPSEIRFYQGGKPTTDSKSNKVIVRQLKGDPSGKASAGDQGVIIAARETCYNLGLYQACYSPLKYTRDEQIAAAVSNAAQDLTAHFSVTVPFDMDGGVAEIIGDQQRAACDRDFTKLGKFPTQALPNCAANLVFTATTQIEDAQPIGLFVVVRPVATKVYDVQGNPVRALPAGNYLVMDATPPDAQSTPGALGALFLVNSDGVTNFLIPSQTSEGFGSTDDQDADARRGQAAIKDGFISGHSF